MSNKKLNIIGQNVKRLRLSKKPALTQEQLAIQLELLDWNIGRFGVSKIERGERQVTDKELFKLAQALSVPIQDLFPQDKY